MIHATACVDDGAVIGEGTQIWHFCHVREGAVVGHDCVLGQNVYIDAGVRIGNRVKIQNNVSVYAGVTIEDDVFLGPSCVFTNVARPRSAFPVDTRRYTETLVRRGATIGANATVVCGNSVGAWSFVAAGAVVTCEVSDHQMVVGVPARAAGWVCRCGRQLEWTDGRVETRIRCECGALFEFSSGAPSAV